MKKITEQNTNTASVAVQTQLTMTDMNNILKYLNWNDNFGSNDNTNDDTNDDNSNISEHSDTIYHELSNDDLALLYEETLILVDEFLLSTPLCTDNANIETELYNHVFPYIYYYVTSVRKDEDEEEYEDDQKDEKEYEEQKEEEQVMVQLKEVVNVAISDYFNIIYPQCSLNDSSIKFPDVEKMRRKIEFLESVYQPEQKTDEWYQHRHGLITASSVWKVFGSQSTQNQLIYEKCSPIDVEKYNRINTESSLHWGQKYEKLSKDIYEVVNNTRIQEFGCIKHTNPAYYFIGASPDGINVCPSSLLYGRMLEIKNVVSRVITGVPKEEYWIQMQVQMEVCRLSECDFLETKFVEYEDEDAFYADSNDENDTSNWNYNLGGKRRGVIVYFIKNEKPFYQYVPLEITSKARFNEWFESTMNTYDALTWIKNIYWRLDVYSCVLVLRNKEWFKNAVVKMEELWKIIEVEKVTGYEHRAPKKRNAKKDSISNGGDQMKIQVNPDGTFIPFSHQSEKICHLDLQI
jgi:putative phage-type endonuclease